MYNYINVVYDEGFMDTLKPNIPDMLRRQMKSGSLSHAYIVSGPPVPEKRGSQKHLPQPLSALPIETSRVKPAATAARLLRGFIPTYAV